MFTIESVPQDIKDTLIEKLKKDQDVEQKYLLAKTIVSAYDALILLDGDFQEEADFICTLRIMVELLDELFTKD